MGTSVLYDLLYSTNEWSPISNVESFRRRNFQIYILSHLWLECLDKDWNSSIIGPRWRCYSMSIIESINVLWKNKHDGDQLAFGSIASLWFEKLTESSRPDSMDGWKIGNPAVNMMHPGTQPLCKSGFFCVCYYCQLGLNQPVMYTFNSSICGIKKVPGWSSSMTSTIVVTPPPSTTTTYLTARWSSSSPAPTSNADIQQVDWLVHI